MNQGLNTIDLTRKKLENLAKSKGLAYELKDVLSKFQR